MIRSYTSASLQSSSGGQSEGGRFDGVTASGGDLVLKQLWKKLFNIDAFSRLLETSEPLDSNAGIEQSFLLSSLMDFQKSLELQDLNLRKYLVLLRRSIAVTRFLAARYF